MANNSTSPNGNADGFTRFWSDFFSRMGAPADAMRMGMPSAQPSNESVKQMQRIFFDAMAKYCDDFMRSEQFLSMMKQTLDQSLTFKQQLDQFLGQALKGMQAPVRGDVDNLAGTLLKIEERVLDRLDSLESKVAAMEGPRRTTRDAGASRAKRPSARGVSAKKAGKRRRSRASGRTGPAGHRNDRIS